MWIIDLIARRMYRIAKSNGASGFKRLADRMVTLQPNYFGKFIAVCNSHFDKRSKFQPP